MIKLNTVNKNWEMWGHHPAERKRLFDLISSTKANGVVFVSGDMHTAQLFKATDTPYPFYDLTASGMDIIYKKEGTSEGPHVQIGKDVVEGELRGYSD